MTPLILGPSEPGGDTPKPARLEVRIKDLPKEPANEDTRMNANRDRLRPLLEQYAASEHLPKLRKAIAEGLAEEDKGARKKAKKRAKRGARK